MKQIFTCRSRTLCLAALLTLRLLCVTCMDNYPKLGPAVLLPVLLVLPVISGKEETSTGYPVFFSQRCVGVHIEGGRKWKEGPMRI